MFNFKQRILNFVETNKNTQIFNGYSIKPASLIKRFFSFFIDSIILTLFLSIVFISPVLKELKKNSGDFNQIAKMEIKEEEFTRFAIELSKNKVLISILFLIPIIYNILCLKIWKATIGQKFFKLTVVSERFDLTLMDIINRISLFVICRANVIILVLSYSIALFMTKKFMFYDIFSGTKVIEMKKIGENNE